MPPLAGLGRHFTAGTRHDEHCYQQKPQCMKRHVPADLPDGALW
jgi:hypothetical protein